MRRQQQSKVEGVGVISKVFQILEAIQGSPSGLTLKPICDITGVHKSTAHRFLKHLEREGYILRTESGAYMIGPRLSQMGARSNHRVTMQAVARPILWELWKSTGETVNLAVLDRATVLYVDVLESPHEFRLASRVGIRRPVHATGLGKALAAFLSEEQREQVLGTVSFQPLTPKTIMNMVQLRQELERVRRQGYAVDNEETTLGARCVSVPIFDAHRFAVAALSISGPVTRIGWDQVPALAEAAKNAARAISAGMGFPQMDSAIDAVASAQDRISPGSSE
jgi:DNA-binding IclR family transcriptional regulator